jgi:hypothetical protein
VVQTSGVDRMFKGSRAHETSGEDFSGKESAVERCVPSVYMISDKQMRRQSCMDCVHLISDSAMALFLRPFLVAEWHLQGVGAALRSRGFAKDPGFIGFAGEFTNELKRATRAA